MPKRVSVDPADDGRLMDFLKGLKQRQDVGNRNLLETGAAVFGGVLGWSAYQKFKKVRK